MTEFLINLSNQLISEIQKLITNIECFNDDLEINDFEDYPEDNAVHPNETGQRRFAQMLEFWLKNLNYAK